MNPGEVRDGMTVVITTDRPILGLSWQGVQGAVWATFDREIADEWVYIQIPDDGTVIFAFAPDEIEPA